MKMLEDLPLGHINMLNLLIIILQFYKLGTIACNEGDQSTLVNEASPCFIECLDVLIYDRRQH